MDRRLCRCEERLSEMSSQSHDLTCSVQKIMVPKKVSGEVEGKEQERRTGNCAFYDCRAHRISSQFGVINRLPLQLLLGMFGQATADHCCWLLLMSGGARRRGSSELWGSSSGEMVFPDCMRCTSFLT